MLRATIRVTHGQTDEWTDRLMNKPPHRDVEDPIKVFGIHF